MSEKEEALAQAIRNSWGQMNPKDDHLRFVIEVEGIGAKPYPPMQAAEELCAMMTAHFDGVASLGTLGGYRNARFRVDDTSLQALRIYEAAKSPTPPPTAQEGREG